MNKEKDSILFSIVILTMSIEEYLPALLDSLAGLDLNKCELLLVNQAKKALPDSYSGFNIVELFPEERLSAPSARNFGAEHAKGIFVVFLDDDCTVFSGKKEFAELIDALDKNNEDIFVLSKGRIVEDKYITDWPAKRPAQLGYFSAPRYTIEWNVIFPRRLFMETGGFFEIGPGTATAAQCGEILILVYRLLAEKVKMRLFEQVKISHPDLHKAQKDSKKVHKYYYGHGFSAGHAIRYIPVYLRLIMFTGFNLKSLILFIFPNLQAFMAAVDSEYNKAYIRKNIRYIFSGFFDGFSGKSPAKDIS